MPENWIPIVVAAAVGLVVGWVLSLLVFRAKAAAASERLAASQARAEDLAARLEKSEGRVEQVEREADALRIEAAGLRSEVDQQSRSMAEKAEIWRAAEVRLGDAFKALSSDVLKSSQEQFLFLARTTLSAQSDEAKGELEARKVGIESMLKPVAESMEKFHLRIGELEVAREGAYSRIQELVRAMQEGQLGLKEETGKLVKALRQPSGRGQWGEMQLLRVVELAGMREHCDFVTQDSTTNPEGERLRPDVIVSLPGGRTIVVDAKTPMDAYLEAIEAKTDAERDDALARHVRQVKQQIDQLGSKNYTARYERTPEFVVLFLPNEAIFSAALEKEPALIEIGVKAGVILATPTTLIALLRAVAHGWREESLAANAREISALGQRLHERLGVLNDHFGRLGKAIASVVGHYNTALGSYESRVLVEARRFETLKASSSGAELGSHAPVEVVPRMPLEAEKPEDSA